jgi:hypothetical protein
MPDDELLDLAEKGKLKDAAVLAKEVNRMLADRRANRFIDDFVDQWLQIRNIHTHDVARQVLADFDPALREAMAEETQLFFESQVRDDRPLMELLTSNYTFLNERLARHYGIDDVYGSHFRRVALTDDRRFGLLGEASILTVSSYADRTSVVLRGKWILENLLGSPPPPMPPGIPPLKENDMRSKPMALRERMEQHRSNPTCASCHASMDPLGFALEHFDAVGKWRETDSGAPINATIDWSGITVDSPNAFREALISRKYEVIRTVSEKLMTYALGRGVDFTDASTVRQLGRELAQGDNRWSVLVLGIVKSPQFQMRRATGASTTSSVASNR